MEVMSAVSFMDPNRRGLGMPDFLNASEASKKSARPDTLAGLTLSEANKRPRRGICIRFAGWLLAGETQRPSGDCFE
jgi:hypothetical protein